MRRPLPFNKSAGDAPNPPPDLPDEVENPVRLGTFEQDGLRRIDYDPGYEFDPDCVYNYPSTCPDNAEEFFHRWFPTPWRVQETYPDGSPSVLVRDLRCQREWRLPDRIEEQYAPCVDTNSCVLSTEFVQTSYCDAEAGPPPPTIFRGRIGEYTLTEAWGPWAVGCAEYDYRRVQQTCSRDGEQVDLGFCLNNAVVGGLQKPRPSDRHGTIHEEYGSSITTACPSRWGDLIDFETSCQKNGDGDFIKEVGLVPTCIVTDGLGREWDTTRTDVCEVTASNSRPESSAQIEQCQVEWFGRLSWACEGSRSGAAPISTHFLTRNGNSWFDGATGRQVAVPNSQGMSYTQVIGNVCNRANAECCMVAEAPPYNYIVVETYDGGSINVTPEEFYAGQFLKGYLPFAY